MARTKVFTMQCNNQLPPQNNPQLLSTFGVEATFKVKSHSKHQQKLTMF